MVLCACTLFAPLQALQEEITSRHSDLTDLANLCQNMSDNASPEDSMTLSGKMAQLKSAYEALERHAAARKRGLDDGLEQVCI